MSYINYLKSIALSLLLMPTALLASTHSFATVQKKTIDNALFFTGKLKPIKSIAVNSPIAGHIQSISFSYGQLIHKGDLLLTLESSEFSKNFQTAFQKYLTAKNKYNNDKETFAGTKMLYKAGVTQRNSYLTSLSSFNTDIIDYYQAKMQLEEMIDKANLSRKHVESLNLDNTDAVKKMLSYHLTDYKIRSSTPGISLFPGDSGSGKSNQKLTIGKSIKEGETLLTIGSLSGYTVSLNVSESSINKIEKSMPVTITGDGFPGITLQGYVSHVSSQANPSQNGRSSTFQVLVSVDKLPKLANPMMHIRIGMTCRASINISQKNQLVVPISALIQQGNSSVVSRQVGDKLETVPVQIGNTTPGGLIIIHGKLNPGDKVLLHDS